MRASLLALALVAAVAPDAHAGSLIDVTVEVAGRPVPLYGATDGTGRLYFEAREGSPYALRLTNRSHERLGALVVVDGLNVISGEREPVGHGRPGRLYVLAPWTDVEVRGWRTSLEQVRQFTFVDERASYATRSGKSNSRMGWIEMAVYRDLTPAPIAGLRRDAPAAEAAGAPSADASGRAGNDDRAGHETKSARGERGYPGTGWGEATHDPAVEVRFDAASHPAEKIVLRYEYAPALRALGILPPAPRGHDRLRERDRGTGFAQPPRW
jgi:hypothetical protein